MNTFKRSPLVQQQSVGERLRVAREAKGWSLEFVAAEVRITTAFLNALEWGRYNDLPSPVYIKNYLRVYSHVLGIPWSDIQKQYEQEIRMYRKKPLGAHETPESILRPGKRQKRVTHVKQSPHHRRALEIPSLLKIGGVSIIILIFLVYFGYGIAQLLLPPSLVVEDPAEDVLTTEQKITFRGYTEPEAVVKINNQEIAVGPDGHFAEEIILSPGLNTIQVTTSSKRRRERAVVRHVLYDDSGTQ